jgi:hypothetical protein
MAAVYRELGCGRSLLNSTGSPGNSFGKGSCDFLGAPYIEVLRGVSRNGVSLAAGLLQMKGLIRYARGRITLLNPDWLEVSSCERYRILSRTINPVRSFAVYLHRFLSN